MAAHTCTRGTDAPAAIVWRMAKSRMRLIAACDSFQPSMAMTLANSAMDRSRPSWKRLRMRTAMALRGGGR